MAANSGQAIRIRAAGVLSEEGKLLVVSHEKDGKTYWLLPGGGVDFGESLEGALQREIAEETSLRIKVGKLLMVSETIAPDGTRHGVHFVFAVRRVSGKLKVHTDARLRTAEFVSWKELPRLLFYPDIGKRLHRLYRRRFAPPVLFTGNIWKK